LVNVTASGLLACPLPATVMGVVRVCELPLVAVEKFQITSLGVVATHPVWVVVSALVVYPVAYVVFVGSCNAVIVTGNGLGLLMLTTTSPVPPGYIKFVADGDATAVIVRFEMAADSPSPEDPLFKPTSQLVAANAAVPASNIPHTAETIFLFLDHRVVCMFPSSRVHLLTYPPSVVSEGPART
jgi:hypothetical protein